MTRVEERNAQNLEWEEKGMRELRLTEEGSERNPVQKEKRGSSTTVA